MTPLPFNGIMRKARLWLPAIAVLAILIAVPAIVDTCREHKREASDYARLDSCQDPLFFEDFIAKHPSNVHTEEVRQRYRLFVARQRSLLAQALSADREALRQLLASNPNSAELVHLANTRLDTLDWLEASSVPTERSIERYIASHPEGAFLTEAQALRLRLERVRLEAEQRALADTLAQADSLAAE